MLKCFVLMCFCIVSLSGKSHAILVANQNQPKPLYSSGIKTKNWKNAGDPITVQNYSKVVTHYNPNSVGQYVIAKTQETQKIYPVYNGHSYGQRPEKERNVLQTQSHTGIVIDDNSRNKKTIFKRKVEYKTLEVYEKCPPSETGQFVYALSCNQYLNCWKGKGSPQNCAPGTLFNPKTRECDFPDKVECITGPRLNSLSSVRIAKSVQQVYCPEGFSGLIPNYTDCSKFINCNNGHSTPMDCPPGTLFDTSKNICDHPSKCTCFDGQSGTEIRVQEGQQTEGSQGLNRGCNQPAGNCQQSTGQFGTSSYDQQTHQTGTHSNLPQGSSGFQFYPGTGGTAGRTNQQSSFSVTYNRTNCNPQYQNCGQSTGHQQIHQIQYGSHTNPQLGSFGVEMHSGPTNCNPQYQNCGQNQAAHGSTIGTSSGQQFYQTQYVSHASDGNIRPQPSASSSLVPQYNQQSVYSLTYNRSECNPQYQNCGQSTGHQQFHQIHSGSTNCNPQYQNCGQNQAAHGSTIGTTSSQQFHQTQGSGTGCNPQYQNCGSNQEPSGPQTLQSGSFPGGSAGTPGRPCNPQFQNCGYGHTIQAQTIPNSRPSTFGQDQTIYSSTDRDSSDVKPFTFEQGYRQVEVHATGGNCDPSVQNCAQGRQDQNIPGNGQTTTKNCCGQTVQTGQVFCDPRVRSCGQQSQNNAPQSSSGQVNCDLSTQNCGQTQTIHGQSRIKSGQNFNRICNVNDRNCQSHSIVAKDIRHGEAKCPDDYQGITRHPFDCSKFLNCANGRTFIQDCAPGTLFNPNLGNCDFPGRVECGRSENYDTESSTSGDWVSEYEEHVQQFGQNSGHGSIRSTTESRDLRTDDRDTITDINVGEIGVVSRPTYERSTHKPLKVDDIDVFEPKPSSTPKSIWPPPFPKPNEVDYVFDYEDGETVTLQPDDVFYATRKKNRSCEESDFHCSADLCITQTMICDGYRDCADGKDEQLCEEYVSRFSVHKNSQLVVMEKQRWINASYATCAMLCIQNTKFTCRSFNYRKIDRTCFLSDQNIGLTGALRKYVPIDYYELTAGSIVCSDRSKYFECYNSKCIMKEQLCDGADDCGDRQDEKNCSAREFGYSVKLAGSKQKNQGRVEVTAFGKTGFICDDQFDITDANVVCRELGFTMGAVEVKGLSFFAKDLKEQNTQYMMDDVDCLGNETTLLDCAFAGWGIHNCRDQEIAGVVCKTVQETCGKGYWKCDKSRECVPYDFVCDGAYDCSDNSDEDDNHCEAPTEIRLVNGSNSAEGRLEVKHNDIWGTVCDDDFNEDAAKVVCRNLGYRGSSIVKKDGFFGAGEGPIWLDQVSCYGNETALEDCTHWSWGENNCEHYEDVGVVCTDSMDEVELQRSSKLPLTYEAGLPKTCGYRRDRQFLQDDLIHARVIGGGVAKEGEYPWQAALKVRVKDKSAHWCGAVIVSSKWVLTAAHCLHGYTKGAYVIVAGEYDTDANSDTRQQKFIDEFFVHERFRQGHKMNNDIALIKVKGTGFALGDDVQPICLPDPDVEYDRNLNCTVSGFGTVKSGVSAYSHKMMAAWIPIHSKEICSIPHIYGNAITDGMICAGFLDGGVDACDGDSGGPLACLDQGLFTLYGITSWGQHCGYANKPGVYVKVAHYRAWIENIIQKHSQ